MQIDSPFLKVLSNVAADETTSQEFGIDACDRLELGVDFKAGVTAGEVILEIAPFGGYTGAWAPLITVTFAAAAPKYMRGQAESAGVVGRVRINTAIANGVIDAYVMRQISGR